MQKALIVLALFAGSAYAIDNETGDYNTQGDLTCTQYLNDRHEGGLENTSDQAWIAGYITAYNAQTPDTYDILGGVEFAKAMLWLDQWCRNNSQSRMSAGIDALMTEAAPTRFKTRREAGK